LIRDTTQTSPGKKTQGLHTKSRTSLIYSSRRKAVCDKSSRPMSNFIVGPTHKSVGKKVHG